MSTADLVKELEQEWEYDSGFFGRLRQGMFDEMSLNRLLDLLRRIDFQHDSEIDRRLVSLLWFMPLFMEWQADRVQEAGADFTSFEKAKNQVQGLLERILGMP